MSCEVAVMNKRGVALAADSAVTLGERKVYHTAEKLFQLAPGVPIAILTYGSADMMGVPWETVVKMFSRKLADQRFDSVEQYAEEFLRFIEVSNSLFPESAQTRSFQFHVGEYWKSEFADQLQTRLKDESKTTPKRVGAHLSELVNRDIVENWNDYELIESLGVAFGDRVLAEYGGELDELEGQIFESVDLPSKTKLDLRTVVRHMYTKKWVHPANRSGIVVAGIAESEPFPVLVHYRVGTIAAGRLRFYKVDEARVTHDDDAMVVPFAQTQVIDMFYRGIFPKLEQSIPGLALECLGEVMGPSGKQPTAEQTGKFEEKIRETLNEIIRDNYTSPLIAAVSALPRYELANLAEALVNLTAFRARMSANEDETVGGPIDVAVISKGDGFVWVKKKGLVRSDVLHSEVLA
jgi:hypothetical protein